MKFVFVSFVSFVVACVVAHPHPRLGLHLSHSNGVFDINKDIKEFLALIPKDKIKQLVLERAQVDQEVNHDLEYAQSDAVKRMGLAIENSAQFLKVRRDLEGVGVNMVYLINYFHDIIGWEHVTLSSATKTSSGGLRVLLDDIKQMIPMTKIKLLAAKKYLLSSGFRKLVKLALSNSFKNDVEAVFDSPEARALMEDAEANNVDLQPLFDFVNSLKPILFGAFNEEILQLD